MPSPKKIARPTPATIKPRTFETVPLANIPGLGQSEQDVADMTAACEIAKKNPQAAVKFFDGFGDEKICHPQQTRLAHFLKRQGWRDDFQIVRRASVVYLRKA